MQVEHMAHSGDDILVVNAARASFGKESNFIGCADANVAALIAVGRKNANEVDAAYKLYVDKKTVHGMVNEGSFLSRADYGLLQYLAREQHVLPFRHPNITLRCEAPVFAARQLGKHQVGMSWSEESRRYVTTPPKFYWPNKWRKAAANVKQGSSDEEVEVVTRKLADVPETHYEAHPLQLADEVVRHAVSVYNDMLDGGVAPELARTVLPQNMYVTWVWTGSLLAYYQLYKLRSEGSTQKEARDFAEMIKAEVSKLYPESWAALEKH